MSPLARKELRDALRNHWLQGYAAVLGLVGLLLAWASAATTAGLAMQAFGRTTAGLTNLCLLLAPLVSLALGAASIAGERDRGTLERLLAQPYRRRDLLLAKYVGLAISLLLATAVGFAPAGVAVLGIAGPGAAINFLLFPALAALVILALLGVGFVISVRSRGGAQAQARAIFLWFCFVMLYDLLLLGTLMSARVGAGVLALLLIANPVSAGRVLVVLSLEADLYLLGPAGAWLVDRLGHAGAASVLVASLLAWAVGSLLLAVFAFRLRSDQAGPSGLRRRVVRRAATDDTESPAYQRMERVKT